MDPKEDLGVVLKQSYWFKVQASSRKLAGRFEIKQIHRTSRQVGPYEREFTQRTDIQEIELFTATGTGESIDYQAETKYENWEVHCSLLWLTTNWDELDRQRTRSGRGSWWTGEEEQ